MPYFIISTYEPETDHIQVTNDTETLYLARISNFEHKAGSRYEVIDASGNLQSRGVVALNYIPVSESGKQTFEQRFLHRSRAIENTPEFIAIKVLRPMEDGVYVVVTQWESAQAFHDWQQSSAYQQAHQRRDSNETLKQQTNVLIDNPYHVVYEVDN